MNMKKLEIAIGQLQKVHRDMNDCANRFILKDAIDQLQEQAKLFAIPVVSNRTLLKWDCDDCKHYPCVHHDITNKENKLRYNQFGDHSERGTP